MATLQSVAEVRFEKPSEQKPIKTRFVGSSAAFFLGQADIVGKNGQALYMWGFLKSFMETMLSVRALSLAAMEWAVEWLWIGSKQDSLAELLAQGTWVW